MTVGDGKLGEQRGGTSFCPPLRQQPSDVIVSPEPVRSAFANRWKHPQILSEVTQQEPSESGPHIGPLLAGARIHGAPHRRKLSRAEALKKLEHPYHRR
jgi:hypothetical protein